MGRRCFVYPREVGTGKRGRNSIGGLEKVGGKEWVVLCKEVREGRRERGSEQRRGHRGEGEAMMGPLSLLEGG